MNTESKIFENKCKEQFFDFASLYGFTFKEETLSNEDSLNELMRISFYNESRRKEIFLDFYGSKGDIIKNEINVFFSREDSYGNKTFFDIPSFLAFKEHNRTIKYEDKLNYRFKLNPSDFNSSISKSLNDIKSILESELLGIISTNDWISIPIHDPRDDY
jgi:hypothetical protein